MSGDRALADIRLAQLGARLRALADRAIAPDLHLVVVEAPIGSHAAFERSPPVPAHLRGRPLACEPRLVPVVPFFKLYYFGDPSLIRPFDDLIRQVVEVVAEANPGVADFLRRTTWEGNYVAANLWPVLMRDKLREWDAASLIRRWRWDVGGRPPLLPYDDAELEQWLADGAGPPGTSTPDQSVNLTWFLNDIINVSADVIRTLVVATFPGLVVEHSSEAMADRPEAKPDPDRPPVPRHRPSDSAGGGGPSADVG